MSRWSEDFESHAIHEALKQTREWLNVEIEDIDSEHEAERRRLIKSLEAIKGIVAEVDPEFFPEPLISQINNHLRHQSFWNLLNTYHSDHSVHHLRNANDHLNGITPIVFQISGLSKPVEIKEATRNVEDAYDAFCQTLEKTKEEFESRISENDHDASELSNRLNELSDAVKELKANADGSLSSWQNDFTEAQTSRAEEHSGEQIKRGKDFSGALAEWRVKSEDEIKAITGKHTEELQGSFETFENEMNMRLEDMKAKHTDILEIHGLVGTDGVAGGYQRGATDERSAANSWRLTAMVALALACGWLASRYFYGFGGNGEVNWTDLIAAGSLTLVLIGTAGYAARQSKIHRDSEQQMRWFALEVKAIDPFMSSLPEEQRNELKKQLTERLFGQNRAASDGGESSIDVNAFKAISSALQSLIKAAK